MHAIHRGLFPLAVAMIALPIMQNRAGATPLVPGDLVISEVMANPSAVSDSAGEWFELFNSTSSSIDLDGLVLSDDGINSHTISGTLIIASGGYLVLGINGDSAANGGYVADYVYSNFLLGNSGDEIVISEGMTEIARLDYSSSFAGAGTSMELSDVGIFPYTQGDFVEATSALVWATSERLEHRSREHRSPSPPPSCCLPSVRSWSE